MKLAKLLSEDFRNHQLFKQAITHRSYAREHNERLEFLGDAVLQLLISEYLYNNFYDKPEGQLTRMRSRLVRKETLSEIAGDLHLRKWLRLGRGQRVDELSNAILADTVEAIIGALYLYQGLQPTWRFIQQIYAIYFEQLSGSDSFTDAKSQLQEYLQARGSSLPEYQLEQSTQQGFRMICKVGQRQTKGKGKTKRDAEQQAARAMLHELESK